MARALFEIILKLGWPALAEKMLMICKCIEKQMWWFDHPLKQFDNIRVDIIKKLEDKNRAGTVEALLEMSATEVGNLVNMNKKAGEIILKHTHQIPFLSCNVNLQPISR